MVPDADGISRTVKDRMQAKHEHAAPCRSSGALVATQNRSGKANSNHQPILRMQPPRGKEPLWQTKRTINAFFKAGRPDNPVKQMPPQPQLSAQAQFLKLFQATSIALEPSEL